MNHRNRSGDLHQHGIVNYIQTVKNIRMDCYYNGQAGKDHPFKLITWHNNFPPY